MVLNVILIVVAYLLGSIPSAVWIGRKYYGIDIREHGSKNAGATNTLRVLGPKAALPVFAIDMLKGFFAVMLANFTVYATGSPEFYNLKIALVAAAVLGHIFPVFAGFRGGKGVATLAGSVLGVHPAAVLLSLTVFTLILIATHYVSLGSMTAGVMFPVFLVFVFHVTYVPLIIFGCLIAVLLIFTHRKNIGRLLSGTESKTYLWKRKDHTEDAE